MNPDEWHIDPRQEGAVVEGNIVFFDMNEEDPRMIRDGDTNIRKNRASHSRRDIRNKGLFVKYFPHQNRESLERAYSLSMLAETISDANYPSTQYIDKKNNSIAYEEISGITLLDYLNHASGFEYGIQFNRSIISNLYEKIKTIKLPSIEEFPAALPYNYGEKIQESLISILKKFDYNPDFYLDEVNMIANELDRQRHTIRFTDRNPTNYLIDIELFNKKRLENPEIPEGIESVRSKKELDLLVDAISGSIRYTDQETLGYSVMLGTDEIHLIEKYPITRENAPVKYIEESRELPFQRFFHHVRWAEHNLGNKLEKLYDETIKTAVNYELLWSAYKTLREKGLFENIERAVELDTEGREDFLKSVNDNYYFFAAAPFSINLDISQVYNEILHDENLSLMEKEIALNMVYNEGSSIGFIHFNILESQRRLNDLNEKIQELYSNGIEDLRLAYDALDSMPNLQLHGIKKVFEEIIANGYEYAVPENTQEFLDHYNLNIAHHLPRIESRIIPLYLQGALQEV